MKQDGERSVKVAVELSERKQKSARRRDYQTEMLCYYSAVVGAARAMPASEHAELEAWEHENLDGARVCTTDWPGWEKYIGRRPVPPEIPPTPNRTPISAALRKQVFERDSYRCRQCGTWLNLSVDHIIPVVRGGASDLANLQTLCTSCNCRKGAN